jgi:transcription initiation factor TFIID TATA-box-binding protein
MNLPIRIVNVVATATLDRTVDIESLLRTFPNEVIYDRKIYGGRVAYFKSKNMKGKVSIFNSGKIISVGTTSLEDARRELAHVAEALNASFKSEPSIQNIVVVTKLDFEADLERIVSLTELRSIYEPDQFPAAILWLTLSEGKTAPFLLFASGKLICSGLKTLEDIHESIGKLLMLIRPCSLRMSQKQ